MVPIKSQKSQKALKILIIEDDKFLLKLYSNRLKREGFEVAGSLTGEEGMGRIAAEKPDLIILDLILPKKNGFEILSEIKLNPKTKKTPVVILTNLGQDSDRQRGMELGAAAYLVKTDFAVNQLPQIIKEALLKAKK